MSICQPSPPQNVFGNAYVVAAPRSCDAVGATLCQAFLATDCDVEQFRDMLRQLDLIPSIPR